MAYATLRCRSTASPDLDDQVGNFVPDIAFRPTATGPLRLASTQRDQMHAQVVVSTAILTGFATWRTLRDDNGRKLVLDSACRSVTSKWAGTARG